MKICVASLLIFSFVGISCCTELKANEQKCATKLGLPLMTLEDYYDFIVCDFEETKLTLRLFIRCVLELANVITKDGEIKRKDDKILAKILEGVPENEDKNEYYFQLMSNQLLKKHRAVPPNCKGNLNKAWLKCATDNGLPEYNTIETLRIILGTTEPSVNFKQFLLCGLKDQKILNENGDLNMESLQTYKHKGFTLATVKLIGDYKDKADFAYKITKPIVRTFIPKDVLAEAINETEINFESLRV